MVRTRRRIDAADEEQIEVVAIAMCKAAAIWSQPRLWTAADRGQATAQRIVNKYRREAAAGIAALQGYLSPEAAKD